MRRVVVDGDDDHAVRALENAARIGAARIVQVTHFTGVTAVEPFRQAAEFGEMFRGDRRDAAKIEAESASAFGDPVRLLRWRHESHHASEACRSEIEDGEVKGACLESKAAATKPARMNQPR